MINRVTIIAAKTDKEATTTNIGITREMKRILLKVDQRLEIITEEDQDMKEEIGMHKEKNCLDIKISVDRKEKKSLEVVTEGASEVVIEVDMIIEGIVIEIEVHRRNTNYRNKKRINCSLIKSKIILKSMLPMQL